ncbi:MAG: carboxypeptidase-like regulatory domain-containing protein [Snowella sp.]|nr:carboxypeptidase-like regulatory domain-containing protein [Snowella sp.]
MMTFSLTTRRVAICGQVVIGYTVDDGKTEILSTPVSQALVEISEYPEGLFKRKLNLLKSLSNSQKWESLSNRPDRTLTTIDGSFHFTDLPLSNYTLRAFYPSQKFYLQTDEVSVTVVESQKPNWVNLILKVSGIAGQVIDHKGSPVVYAQVKFKDSKEYTLCDRDGKFQLLNLKTPPSSPVQLIVSAPNYDDFTTKDIILSEGILYSIEPIQLSKKSPMKNNGTPT